MTKRKDPDRKLKPGPKHYDPVRHPVLIEALARLGKTDEEIARYLNIRTSTLNKWKAKYPETVDAMSRGKGPVDLSVENALLQNALGHELTTEHVSGKLIDGKLVPSTFTRSKMKVAGSVTAQMFWLRNRMRDRWTEDAGGEGGAARVTIFMPDNGHGAGSATEGGKDGGVNSGGQG